MSVDEDLDVLDMPQLLSRVVSNDRFRSGPETLNLYPELAAKIGGIVASWSHVENNFALLFIMLIGAQSDAAMAMYQALEGSTAKDASLKAAAENALDEDRLRIFLAVRKVVKRVARQRNNVVHGLIGHCPDLADAFVIVSQRAVQKQMFLLFIKQHDLTQNPKAMRDEATKLFRKEAYVYKSRDFDEILERCEWAGSLTMNLAVLCTPVHPERERSRALLLSEPLIQKELDRLAQGQKTQPSEP